jgi:hypothetical protein
MFENITWVQLAQGLAAIVTILMAVAIGPLFKLLHKIKTNDLHHLDLKIDEHHKVLSVKIDEHNKVMSTKIATLADGQSRLETKLGAVENKLDSHIQWHLDNRK